MVLSKKHRELVWYKYNKHCAYCGEEIDLKDMQVDHIKPKRADGADSLDNYNPSCRLCNHYKRANTPELFKSWLLNNIHERLRKNYIFKVAERFGIVSVKPFDNRDFYYETVERKRKGRLRTLINEFKDIDCETLQAYFIDDILELLSVIYAIYNMQNVHIIPMDHSLEVHALCKIPNEDDILLIKKGPDDVEDDTVDIEHKNEHYRIPCNQPSFIKWLNEHTNIEII